MEYFCCNMHHSSYCPECRGEKCEARTAFDLDMNAYNIHKKKTIKPRSEYKVQQLKKMLKYEEQQPEDKQYGAHLTHWSGRANPINIDAGALRLLIEYYNEGVEVDE